MSRSHPAVHPLEEAVVTEGLQNAPRVRMKDLQGMPGTTASILLRFTQFAFALVALCVMATTNDFPTVAAFRYLVAAASLQSSWSLLLAIVDIYALLVKRCLRNPKLVVLYTLGDGIISTLTFGAASAAAGITVLIGNDFNNCAQNHCTRFEISTAMAFMSWFACSPSFFLNFWTLASM